MAIPGTQPAIEFFNQRGITLKIEATEGTDAVPTNALNAFQLFTGTSKLSATKVERPVDRPFFTNDPFVNANPIVSISGGFELVPPPVPGAADATGTPTCDAILLPGGMTVVKTLAVPTTVVGLTRYNPISRTIKSATGYWSHAGTFMKLLGARNQLSSIVMKIGDRFMGQVAIQAAFDAVTEASLPTDYDYSGFVVPTVAEAENTVMTLGPVGGTIVDVLGKSLEISFVSTLNSQQYTEKRFNNISARKPTFKMRIARPAIADFDANACWKAGTLIQSSFQLLEPDGRYSELGIRGQIEDVQDANDNGDRCYDITGRCIASSSGGDELYIGFGGP